MDPRFLHFFVHQFDALLKTAQDVTQNPLDAWEAVDKTWEHFEKKNIQGNGVLDHAAYLREAVRKAAQTLRRRPFVNPSDRFDTLTTSNPKTEENAGADDRVRRDDEALRDAMELLSKEHREIVEIFIDCAGRGGGHELAAKAALDILVAKFGKGQDPRAVRNTQKVRLKVARDRLFLLFRLCRIVAGCARTLDALSDLLLQGDEHYDQVGWGMKRRGDLPAVAQLRLACLVQCGAQLHEAFQTNAVENPYAHALRDFQRVLKRLTHKYAARIVRRNRVVVQHFTAQDSMDNTCTMDLLRADLSQGHLRCLLCGNDLPPAVGGWAKAKLDASSV